MIAAFLAVALIAGTPQASEVAIGEEGRRLHGTMLAPPAPADGAEPVLILAGSGPTDRDGNNPLGIAAAPYRLLAQGLAERGIPSLRVDKRGVGASAAAMPSERGLRIETYGEDARAWAAELTTRTGARCVWLLGHSEGALHALLAAERNDGICGLILVAAPGRPLGDILAEQLRANPANAPILDQALAILAEISAGRAVAAEAVPPALMPLFRPSVQPFFMSMLALDPAELVRRRQGPMLVIQGITDIQTSIVDAERLGAAREGVEVRLIDGMNHVLKAAPADRAANIATYANPDLPLAPGLIEAVADFVLVEAAQGPSGYFSRI